MLSDNGTPFSSNSVKRLSKLSVRWIRLGIEPRLIQPGKPQQNGRHERMHRTMKAEACAHPAADCRRQQPQFDKFAHQFNYIRPHEALGQTPPARSYERSSREYPKRLPEIAYPSGIIRFGPIELGYHSEREHKLHLDRSRPALPATESNQQPDKE
jgi:hypothetical protein